MSQRVVISGCSSGGKSTLLAALRDRGYAVMEEPGLRVVRAQQETGGRALPWVDADAFLVEVERVARDDLRASDGLDSWVFFDRGLIDARSARAAMSGQPIGSLLTASPYHPLVFLAPPWPEIYEKTAERQHDFEEAKQEYERLLADYPKLGHEVMVLPKVSVDQRVEFVLSVLAEGEGEGEGKEEKVR